MSIRLYSILFLIFLSLPTNVQCSLLAPVYSTKRNLIKAITTVFKSDPIQNIGNINIYAHYDVAVRFEFTDQFSELTRELCVETCYIKINKTVISHQYEHSNLVLVDTLKSLRYLYETLLEIGTRNLAYTLIYISSLQHPQNAILQNVFQHFYAGSVLSVGIIMELSNMDIIIVSYNPFGLNACLLASPFVLNTYQWQQERWLSTNYFPEHLTDFQLCPITTASWEDRPFLWISYDNAGRFAGYEGIDGKLLEFLADTLNISIVLYTMNDNEKKEAYNVTGLIFNQIFKRAHFAFGGFYNRADEDNILPLSQSDWYAMTSLFFVVTVIRELSSYEKLTLPFSELVWYLTILTAMLGIMVIFVARFASLKQQNFILGTGNRSACYKLYSLALGGNYAPFQLPRRNFARFLLMLWFLATLVLRSAYQSGIYQFLRIDKQRNPPSTIQEIVTQDYIIQTHTDNTDLMEFFLNVDKKKVRYFSISPLLGLEKMATLTKKMDTKIAMLVVHEYYGYFRKLNPISKQVHVSLYLVKQRLYSQQMVLYVRKNSYLVQVLNSQIEKAHNYGFIQKWRRLYVDERVTGEPRAEEGDDNDKPLNLQQMQNIFEILLWMLLVSTAVFGLELIYENYLRRLRCKLVLKTRHHLSRLFHKKPVSYKKTKKTEKLQKL